LGSISPVTKEHSAYEAALALLRGEQRPTAIFTANNLMTIGVLRVRGPIGWKALHRKIFRIGNGLRVPAYLFDNLLRRIRRWFSGGGHGERSDRTHVGGDRGDTAKSRAFLRLEAARTLLTARSAWWSRSPHCWSLTRGKKRMRVSLIHWITVDDESSETVASQVP